MKALACASASEVRGCLPSERRCYDAPDARDDQRDDRAATFLQAITIRIAITPVVMALIWWARPRIVGHMPAAATLFAIAAITLSRRPTLDLEADQHAGQLPRHDGRQSCWISASSYRVAVG